MDKEEALKQIETIKNAVINKGYIMPESPGHYFVWAALSAIGITAGDWSEWFVARFGVSYELVLGVYFTIMLLVGFGASGWFFSKEMQKNDHACTPHLRALRTIYLSSIGFASILTVAMARFDAIVFIYGVWIFAIGFSMYVENAVSRRFFGELGLALVAVSALYVLGGSFYLPSAPTDEHFCALNRVGETLSLVFISGMFAYLGARLLVKRRCDV